MVTEGGSSKEPRAALKGCLGEFVGEGLILAAAAVLAGALALGVRGIDVLLQDRPGWGMSLSLLLAMAFAYGLLWTIRVRPGLYLENLKGDVERQRALGIDRRRRRIAGMIYFQLICLAVVGYLITVAVWSRP